MQTAIDFCTQYAAHMTKAIRLVDPQFAATASYVKTMPYPLCKSLSLILRGLGSVLDLVDEAEDKSRYMQLSIMLRMLSSFWDVLTDLETLGRMRKTQS